MSAFGFWLPFTGDKRPEMWKAAAAQVAKATAGSRLSDHTKAEDTGLFWQTGADLSEAYLKTAYWLAVAARVVGNRALAATALGNLNTGYALMATYASSDAAKIAGVYSAAALAAQNAGAKAVAAVLGYHASGGAIANRQQNAYQQSLTGQTVEALRKTGQDVVPGGKGSTPTWLYAIYAAGAIGGVLILSNMAKPYVSGAKAVVKSLAPARTNRGRRSRR